MRYRVDGAHSILHTGPPGQVAALAGKKDGMKQGALAGVLKDAGFTEDQVRRVLLCAVWWG